MNWDQDSVAYTNQRDPNAESQFADPRAKSQKDAQAMFRQFLREFRRDGVAGNFEYREKLRSNYNQGQYKLAVDFDDVTNFDQYLAEQLWKQPEEFLPMFESAAQEVIALGMVPRPRREDLNQIQIQLQGLKRNRVPLRGLGARHISQLICTPGIVISTSKVTSKATSMTIMCSNCRASKKVRASRGFGVVNLPRRCDQATDEKSQRKCPLDPFIVLPDKSDFVDMQKLKIQENPEDIPTGEMPRTMWLSCERALVEKVKAGSRVNVIGIYSVYQARQKGSRDKQAACIRQPYIRVVGIEQVNAAQQKGTFSPEDEEELRALSRHPDLYNMIWQSIAPAIWEGEDIKKAIACLLFGGSRKLLPDGARLRGDINVLLLGDPSVAKSQFLKFVHQIAPIGVYTSGKGSSAAGLTASVIRDPASGEFHLEGGAMVLADGGIVCIDEFDKMREQDRVAIHEAMEQQTISIAKAGITTILNSRASVLAAANPIYGRYDEMKSTSEQIDFQTTILSRFDLIFIIRDKKDRRRDAALASHIIDLHINADTQETQVDAPIAAELLSKYVAFARHTCHPRLTEDAADALRNHYVSFRRDAHARELQTGESSAIPITVRQLEAVVRLSEAQAKMRLSEEANRDHVHEAVRLFNRATMKAAKEGIGRDIGGIGNPEFRKQVQKAENHFRTRVPIGNSTQIKRIVRELVERGHEEAVVHKAIEVMFQRGEVELRNQRRTVYRKK